jgi:hypothetical protein
VSISLSIYQKLCPACTSSVDTGAKICHCGHVFDGAGGDAVASEAETALRDEELYENYLVARAEQARQASVAAEDYLAADPGNSNKISAAELARDVVKSIEGDLAEQRAKIAALRKYLKQPVQKTPRRATEAESAKPARTTATAPAIAAPIFKSIPAPRISPRPAAPAAVSPVTTPSATASAQSAAGALAAIKIAKARETAIRAQQAAEAARLASAAQAGTAGPSTAVPPGFRKQQAARAEKIEARRTAEHKDCPNCTAKVPANTTRCGCGFAFAVNTNELPSLTLCTGDFTALRNSFILSLNHRGRS